MQKMICFTKESLLLRLLGFVYLSGLNFHAASSLCNSSFFFRVSSSSRFSCTMMAFIAGSTKVRYWCLGCSEERAASCWTFCLVFCGWYWLVGDPSSFLGGLESWNWILQKIGLYKHSKPYSLFFNLVKLWILNIFETNYILKKYIVNSLFNAALFVHVIN